MTGPTTLRQVAAERRRFPELPLSKPLGEFLDAFYDAPSAPALTEEPCDGPPVTEAAYLAAAAEYLSNVYGFTPPPWVGKPQYFLNAAYWPDAIGPATRAIFLAESPTSFRRRFIFTEGRPLRRKKGPVFIHR